MYQECVHVYMLSFLVKNSAKNTTTILDSFLKQFRSVLFTKIIYLNKMKSKISKGNNNFRNYNLIAFSNILF